MRQTVSLAHDVMVPLAVLTPATAFVLSLPVLGGAAIYAAGVALAAALVVASPLLAWWLRTGRGTRWFELTVLGAAGGVLPLLAWGLAVAVMDGDFGVTFVFAMFVLLFAAIGAATGTAYWLLFLRPSVAGLRRRGAPGAVAMLLLLVAAPTVPRLWPLTWPKYVETRGQMTLSWRFGAATDEAGTREIRLGSDALPGCDASIYLPALQAALERGAAKTIVADLTHIRARWGRERYTRVERIHAIPIPAGPTTFIQGCLPWQHAPRR